MAQRYRSARQKKLSAVARETKAALPDILQELPNLDASSSTLHSLNDLPALLPKNSPGFTVSADDGSKPTLGFTTQVVNDDTLDTAIRLSKAPPATSTGTTDTSAGTSTNVNNAASRVCVLNLASDAKPGGGWLSGALAQEETLCYRSSLALSLHKEYYPLPPTSGIYSPTVVIIRHAYGAGHELIKDRKPKELDVVSVISIAAIRRPETKSGRGADGEETFADPTDRQLTKDKMRLALRIAGTHGHTKLVLGALGCGAFRNPAGEVARCWVEVLGEDEFSCGRFEEVMFAVLDKGSDGGNGGRGGKGNFETFEKALGGKVFIAAVGEETDEKKTGQEETKQSEAEQKETEQEKKKDEEGKEE